MRRRLLWMGMMGAMLMLPACAHVKVEPIEVKPIYITMDVNIRVDRQLDQFFAFEDKYQNQPAQPPATTQSVGMAPKQSDGGAQ